MKRTNKFKTEHGITLVALIITIIVLVILAAVSINAVFNANFIGLATNGTINYAEAQANEEKEMENLDSFLQNTITKLDENDFSGNNPDNPPSSVIIPNTENDIGKYVDYVPTNGTYTALKQYTGTDMLPFSEAGYNKDQNFVTDTTLKWRIFKVDSNNLYLISDIPTTSAAGGFSGNTGKLQLYSFNGYNNGVKLLNDMCNSCYSNLAYSGIDVRNLNIEDIENVTKYDYTKYKDDPVQHPSSPHSYNGTQLYPPLASKYPNIWDSLERGTNVITNRSKQNDWITGFGGGTVQLTFRGNYWYYKYSAENASTEWDIPKYYELLMSPSNDANYYPFYWISSRYVRIYGNQDCLFDLQHVGGGAVTGGGVLYHGDNQNPWRTMYNIRPLVSIPLSSCNITARWK